MRNIKKSTRDNPSTLSVPSVSGAGQDAGRTARLLGRVTVLAMISVANVALANPSRFETATETYVNGGGDIGATCSGCHVSITRSTSMTVRSDNPAHDATTADLSMGGRIAGSRFRWGFLREGSSGDPRIVSNDTTDSISFPLTSDSMRVRFCAAQNTGSNPSAVPGPLFWNCGVTNITRADSPNSPPEIASISDVSLDVGASRTVSVSVTDDAPGVELSVSSADDDVVSVSTQGNSAIVLDAEGEGSTTVTVRATDAQGAVDTTSFDVVVSAVPVNQSPSIESITAQTLQVGQNVQLTISVQDEDPETVALSLESNSNSSSVSASLSGNTLSLQALLPGSSTIELMATDSAGLTGSGSVVVTVGFAPVPPIIAGILPTADLTLQIEESASVTLDIDDDPVNGELFFSGSSSDTDVVTVQHEADGRYVVTATGEGRATLTLTVRNEFDLEASIDVNVQVNRADEAPVANDDQFVFDFRSESMALDVLANDTDPEGSALTIRLDSAQSELGGTISLGEQVVSYFPPPLFSQRDSFTYQVIDSAGNLSNSATVTVLPSDTDGDGSFDDSDNCLVLANADQLDTDGDAIGNACDPDPDGDGILGEAGNPFTTGQFLVERVCLECHRTGLVGSPAFGDDSAWLERVTAAGGIEPLLNSVTVGKGAMPAFGNQFTARELSQAILYLTGIEDPAIGGGNFIDRDFDGINDLSDNCINHPNSDQRDTDSDDIGDACEPDENNDGILDYSLSFQFFQETPQGRVNGGIVRAGAGQVTVLARTRADIQGLSYDWSASDGEILALFEGAPTSDVVTFTPSIANTGVYNLDVSIQGNGIRGKTRARLVVVDSPVVDDLSDLDYDGIPASIDNDNNNANRILSNPQSPGSSSVFYSDQSITLGAFTAQRAADTGYASTSASLSQSQFLSSAQARFPDITPVADSTIDNSIGVMDFELRDLDTDSANIRLNLLGNIPINAALRIYHPQRAAWSDFVTTSSDSLASAPTVNGECPASSSPNYTSGLVAGQGCVRFRLTDGGPNDADGTRDGVIAMTGVIGSLFSVPPNEGNAPEDVDVRPASSGGGTLSLMLLLLLSGAVAKRSRSSTHASC